MLEHLFGKNFMAQYSHYLAGIGVIIVGFIVSNIVVSVLSRILDHHSKQPEDKERAKELLSKIHFPVNLVFLSIAIYVVHKLGDYPKSIEPYLMHGMKAVADIAFFMALYQFAAAFVLTRLFVGFGIEVNNTVKTLVADLVKLAVAILGVVTVLGNFNINIGPVLGGLTVLTSAVALAAKDSIQGFIGSLTVVLESKFKAGDWIKMGDLEGFVEHIGIRTTSVRGFDSTLTVIPNDVFVSGKVTNFSKVNNWEINTQVVLSYKSTQKQLENIVTRYREWLSKNPDVKTENSITAVRFNNLTDHGFNLFLFFYTTTNEWLEHMRVREQCMFELMKIIEDEGTALAYPTRSIFMEDASKVAPKPVKKVAAKPAATAKKK